MAITSGLIQRLKWITGLRALFVYVGPRPEASRLLVLLLEGPDAASLAAYRAMSNTLVKARYGRLPVSVVHDAGQVVIRSVDLRFSLVQVDGIEITQAIQTLGHTVPLLAEKGTVARVYLSAWPGAPATVRGTLRIIRNGVVDTFVPSDGDAVLNPAEFGQTGVKRDDAVKTLNFLLPADKITAGVTDVRLDSIEDTAGGSPLLPAPPNPTQSGTFVATPPLRITVIGFSYVSGAPPQTFMPTALDFDLLRSWLRRAYPVGEVIWSQRVVAANATAPFTCGQINSQLAAIRALDVAGTVDARTHYYGLVSDSVFFMRGCAGVPSSPNPGAVGSGPTGPASWGWDFDGSYGDWYGGHELGHTFGRLHPGFCGESQNDLANYPFDNGQLSDADGLFAGFDVGDAINGLPMRALPGVQWHDVMTYCVRQWLSSYTYLGIRQRLIAEDALAPGPGMGAGRPDERFPKGAEKGLSTRAAAHRRLVHVIGGVNLNRGVGKIEYVLPSDRGEPSSPNPQSRVTIQAVGPKQKVLATVQVDVIPVANEGHESDERGMVSTIVAVHPEATRLELLIDGQLVDAFDAEPNLEPPADVRLSLRDDRLDVAWGALPREGSRVTYDVLISNDGGRSWQTVGVGLKSPGATITDPSLSHAGTLRVRIRANGGFEVREAEFDLSSARNPPPRSQ
jgi:hypothetical protein